MSSYSNNNTSHSNDNIVPGSGYSSDTQQLAPQTCYDAEVGSVAGQESLIKLDSATSFHDMLDTLQIQAKIDMGFGNFSMNAEGKYFKSIEDKSYSMSLNYFQYLAHTVSLQLQGYGINALNNIGKDFYNEGKNPYFGILCGDYYIPSYKQGGLLLTSLNIQFTSHEEKKEFQMHAHAGFGSILSASADIERIAKQYDISGHVFVQAFQKGGEPSELAKIFSKSEEGEYYVSVAVLQI